MAESTAYNAGASEQLVNDPSSQLFASLADFYRENGLLSEAIEICRSGLENNPDNLEGRLVLAKCFFAARNFSSAREQVTRVLTIQPENTAAKKLLGEIDREEKPAAATVTPKEFSAKTAEPAPAEVKPKLEYVESIDDAKAKTEAPAPLPPADSKITPARPQAEPGPPQTDRPPMTNYHRVLQDLVQTPQIMAGLLVDESGFVVASAYDPKSQAATEEEAAGALAVSIFKTGRESMQKIRMGELEKIVIDTAGEKIFLNRAGSMLLLVSAETSAKVGLVAVNTRQAVDRVKGQGPAQAEKRT
jgi:predicted regulator of Ras-like GTPase activity (Roadblock/LC7/MglB family)